VDKAEYSKVYRARKREALIKNAKTITCKAEGCKERFKQFPSAKIYCSKECSKKEKIKRDLANRRKPVKTFECENDGCKVTIKTRSGVKKFCSKKCKDEKNKQNRKAKDKVYRDRNAKIKKELKQEVECELPTCNIKFIPEKNQKFCCKSHRLKSYSAKPPKMIDRECVKCGKPFSTQYTRKVYCSKPCQDRQIHKPIPRIPCKSCGKEFQPTVPQGVYCTKRCRMDLANQKKIDERRAKGIMAKPVRAKKKAKTPKKKTYTPITVAKAPKKKTKLPKSMIDDELFVNDEATVKKKKLPKINVPVDGTYGEKDQEMIEKFIKEKKKQT
jgi:hypothetical protein